MIDGLKDTKIIVIDEFYQLSPFHIQILYYASIKYNIQIRASGDAQQVPSPDDTSVYNLKENDFINKIFFKNHVHLGYNKLSCRFTNDLPVLLKQILDTQYIPTYFKDKVFTVKHYNFDFYLCLKCDDATHLAKAVRNKKM